MHARTLMLASRASILDVLESDRYIKIKAQIPEHIKSLAARMDNRRKEDNDNAG